MTSSLSLDAPSKDLATHDRKAIYVDEDTGDDSTKTTGTIQDPFRTLLAAHISFPPQSGINTPIYYTRAKNPEDGDGTWKEASKSALKKTATRFGEWLKTTERQNIEEIKRKAAITEARKVIIEQDASLPAAVKLKISELQPEGLILGNDTVTGTRVKVVGRIANIRASKTRTFVYLTDTRGELLCLFSGSVNVVAPILLQKQASLEIYGEMKEVPAENKAPGDRELHVDYYKIIGEAPGGLEAFTSIVPNSADQAALPDFRHLVLRRTEESRVMKVRASALSAFRQYYKEHDMREASAPSFVQTQVEGGGSLFSLPYYGGKAYLTQTSQLYLETQLPVLGDCYAIQSSFRAENSHTRRHLSEYTHIEGELDFITFGDLLQHIEDFLCGVINILLADPESASYILSLNPGFKTPSRPFRRMRYDEAIEWLVEHKITTDEDKPYAFGIDISESAERAMTDQIGVPVMLTHFPVHLKAFYMKKDPTDPQVTESVDVLVPGVGEVVGSGMRMDDYGELLAVMEENKWDLASYAFYADQRKYGSSPHGGYGMGLERFLAWILKRHTVRECVPFPRYPGKWSVL
ncbi:uncharacterized protein KY384_005677 [Bacidia gigantensis]|uniref:uncharacterized protein n=1 Tax=Bacidia gigantensis TaxID=2732470 RepID=UPI001D05671C|nr:uncharacterized protein KY384_005677 [Bacidia gigantensis]KAG8529043.1 hypothetical protein KY384_005677 [Bacidia gigantensis]